MKATGIVRRIDDLGHPQGNPSYSCHSRGDPLEIYTTDGGVLFRKYEQPTETRAATAQKWLEDNALPMRATSAKFSIENKTTTCEVVSNNSRQTGTATATAKDTFIPAVGMVIAFCRATGRPVPQELLED